MILLNKFATRSYVTYDNNDLYQETYIYIGKKFSYRDSPWSNHLYKVCVSLNVKYGVREGSSWRSLCFSQFHNDIFMVNLDKNISFHVYDMNRYISENLSTALYYCLYNVRYSKDKQYQDKYRNARGNMEI